MQISKKVIDYLIDYCNKNDRELIYVGVCGSQNYGLNNENSDIDLKCIVSCSQKDLFNEETYTHLIENVGEIVKLPKYEHADLHDIKSWLDMTNKGGYNFLEIFMTKYFWINPCYSTQIIRLRKYISGEFNKKNIGHIALSLLGQISEKQHNLCHPYPSQEKEIAKYGYIRKQLSHALRCKNLWSRLSDYDALDSMVPVNKNFLFEGKDTDVYAYKTNKILTPEEAQKEIDKIFNETKDYMKGYFEYEYKITWNDKLNFKGNLGKNKLLEKDPKVYELFYDLFYESQKMWFGNERQER